MLTKNKKKILKKKNTRSHSTVYSIIVTSAIDIEKSWKWVTMLNIKFEYRSKSLYTQKTLK